MTPPNTTGAQALREQKIARESKDSLVKRGHEESAAAFVTYDGAAADLNQLARYVSRLERAADHAISVLAGREQAGAVACKRCHGSGSIEDGQITHHECGIPYENGPVQCIKDCPACNGAGKFFAAPGAAIAAREQEALTVKQATASAVAARYVDGRDQHKTTPEPTCTVCRGTGSVGHPPIPCDVCNILRISREFSALASREEAPVASGAHEDANDEKRRRQSEYEQAIWDRGYEAGVNRTGRTAPEQSAKGLTMGGEVDE